MKKGSNTPKYTFVTTCIEAKGRDIIAMVDNSIEIQYSTFLKYVGRAQIDAIWPDYKYIPKLHLGNDYTAFYRSTYRGRKCVYVVWSAIEFVFCEL